MHPRNNEEVKEKLSVGPGPGDRHERTAKKVKVTELLNRKV